MRKQLKNIGITEMQLQIISLFTKGFDKTYYIREVAKLLSISPHTAQINLEDIEKKGVLESKTQGKIRTFKLRKSEHIKEYLLMTELYKKLMFMQKELVISEFITKATPYISGIGILFGSYTKGLATKESDVDLFIVGEYNQKKVAELGKEYGLEINVKNYSLDTFKSHFRDDVLIREILNNHICLVNAEEFITEVIKNL